MSEEKNTYSSDFLNHYLEKKRFGSKFWMRIVILIVVVGFLVIFGQDLFKKSPDSKLIKEAISFHDISSQWVVKGKIQQDDFEGIVLVPQVRFKITNRGEIVLKNTALIGVFTFMDIANVRGEGYQVLEEQFLQPGQTTGEIVLTSDRGYQATSKQAFRDNKNWKRSAVRLFVRSDKGTITYLETFYISQRIEGMDIDVQLSPSTD